MMANEKITKALVQRPLSKISQLLQEFALMVKAPAKHSDVHCRNTDLVSLLSAVEGIKVIEQTHHFSSFLTRKIC